MRLFVQHRTEYVFTEPQTRLIQLLRLTPGSHAGQSVVSWSIDVDRDARLKPARDGYGNETTMLYVDGPLDAIALTVSGEVLTEDRVGMIGATVEPLPPLHFLQSTPLTSASRPLAEWVAEFAAGGDRLAAAHRLNDGLHERLELIEADRTLDHRAAACFEAGRADPQGAAHVLIAAARLAGLPARYVAGHLFREGVGRTEAGHGWAELFVEGYGWIGFDPHQGCCPTDTYIRVAIGLDHAQAAPISGHRIGGGDESLDVAVDVGPGRAAQA